MDFNPVCLEEQEIVRLADLYKKYIRLNDNTSQFIKEQMNDILAEKPILAVHIRGTDFSVGLGSHPIIIKPEEYLETVKRVYAEGNYKKVFLATDDLNALELFKGEFKDKLLYYKLGLEVLRDIYTLANCDSIVCGLSQVSIAARYVNLAMGRKYREVVVIDHGVNKEKSSLEAVKYLKEESMKKHN